MLIQFITFLFAVSDTDDLIQTMRRLRERSGSVILPESNIAYQKVTALESELQKLREVDQHQIRALEKQVQKLTEIVARSSQKYSDNCDKDSSMISTSGISCHGVSCLDSLGSILRTPDTTFGEKQGDCLLAKTKNIFSEDLEKDIILLKEQTQLLSNHYSVVDDLRSSIGDILDRLKKLENEKIEKKNGECSDYCESHCYQSSSTVEKNELIIPFLKSSMSLSNSSECLSECPAESLIALEIGNQGVTQLHEQRINSELSSPQKTELIIQSPNAGKEKSEDVYILSPKILPSPIMKEVSLLSSLNQSEGECIKKEFNDVCQGVTAYPSSNKNSREDFTVFAPETEHQLKIYQSQRANSDKKSASHISQESLYFFVQRKIRQLQNELEKYDGYSSCFDLKVKELYGLSSVADVSLIQELHGLKKSQVLDIFQLSQQNILKKDFAQNAVATSFFVFNNISSFLNKTICDCVLKDNTSHLGNEQEKSVLDLLKALAIINRNEDSILQHVQYFILREI